ncbi:MAG: PEP-CTERM sorting domain-containing protein [Isosphaeraceae bacterium]
MMTMSRGAGWRPILLGWAVAVGLSVAAGTAHASYLSFNLNAQPGSGRISYKGGSNPLEGTDLGILTVKGIDTPSQDGEALLVNKGTLNFKTGPSLTSAQPSVTSAATEWNFSAGGSLTVSGGIPALGIPDGTPLVTGSFSDPSFVRSLHTGPLPGTDLKVQGGAFVNIVNDKLANYFGLPLNAPHYVGGLSTLFSASGNPGEAFSSEGYTSGQLTTTPVPEPSTLVVLTVAAGVGLAYRRRRSA